GPGADSGLDQPNGAINVEQSSGNRQGGRRHGAGGHRGGMSDDSEPGRSRAGGGKRAVDQRLRIGGGGGTEPGSAGSSERGFRAQGPHLAGMAAEPGKNPQTGRGGAAGGNGF